MALKISLRGTPHKPNQAVVPRISGIDWGRLEILFDQFEDALLDASASSRPQSLEAQIAESERLMTAATTAIRLGSELLELIQSGRPHPEQGIEETLAQQTTDIEQDMEGLQTLLSLQQDALSNFKTVTKELATPSDLLQEQVSAVLEAPPIDDGESN